MGAILNWASKSKPPRLHIFEAEKEKRPPAGWRPQRRRQRPSIDGNQSSEVQADFFLVKLILSVPVILCVSEATEMITASTLMSLQLISQYCSCNYSTQYLSKLSNVTAMVCQVFLDDLNSN